VTVRGQYFRGRATIAEGHRFIFRTIYKDSTNQIRLLHARPLGSDLILGHAQARLSVPAGPMAGDHVAVMSMVLVPADGGWRVGTFHNTFKVDEPPGGVRGMEQLQDHAAGPAAWPHATSEPSDAGSKNRGAPPPGSAPRSGGGGAP
jgi:uncharacterized protein (TIGR02246 family)